VLVVAAVAAGVVAVVAAAGLALALVFPGGVLVVAAAGLAFVLGVVLAFAAGDFSFRR